MPLERRNNQINRMLDDYLENHKLYEQEKETMFEEIIPGSRNYGAGKRRGTHLTDKKMEVDTMGCFPLTRVCVRNHFLINLYTATQKLPVLPRLSILSRQVAA